MKIPEKFYKADKHPRAESVGQLKKLLAQLPDDLPVSDGWRNAPAVVVFNHGQPDMHLQLCEADE
jgi:hypothetical protein